MDVAGSIWLAVFGLLIVAAVLAGGIFICRFIYGVMYEVAVPWDSAWGDWKEEPDHPNWHLEKEFKTKFWRGVAVIVIVLSIVLILVIK